MTDAIRTARPSLTTLELDVLGGIYRSEYTDGFNAPCIWSWSINAEIATRKQLSGVVSSLVKKGIVVCTEDGEDSTIAVTELGHELALSHAIRTEQGY